MKEQIKNIKILDNWVVRFSEKLEKKDIATIITLSGEVGAGKTTLTQSLARNLEITEPITSPTFVIQKEYKVQNHLWIKKLIHIDAYRLENKEDLECLGWSELVKDPHNIIVIEWPEVVTGIETPESISLHLEINNDHSRTITKI
ncbi:MAG: tRNA threonylcarbamoyladenosine biosynthesis protein TsaE [Crocinitomicaceae bacterium]|jgi:tRNA threonylcarbamoyladenosine biosynthesis protein TsaE